MADNGLELVIVDGTVNGGWKITLAGDTFAQITAPAFYGADRVAFADTYFLFNKPNTPQFYVSDSMATTFDPLWFADKVAFSDELISIAVAKRELWLLGSLVTEVWYNNGAATEAGLGISQPTFPYQLYPAGFVDHGCVSTHSVATYEGGVFWLGMDRAGQGIVWRGADYKAIRISSFAIENVILGYAQRGRIDDAIGFVYSLGGHVCYVLTFPSADATWVFDIITGQWHEWAWIDPNGEEHRHRANCCAAIDGVPVVGDWQNGNLYALDASVYTDDGQPIKRQRAFPHILNDGKRAFYSQFIADIETGMEPGTGVPGEYSIINATFTAPGGTAIEDYIPEAGGSWIPLDTGGVVEANAMVGEEGSTPLYEAAVAPETPDYTISFTATPSGYDAVPDGVMVFAVGRAASGGMDNTGYGLTIEGDGAQYWLTLDVGGASSTRMSLGVLTAGSFVATLSMKGETISASVRRTEDGLRLRDDGVWTAAQVDAITITDATYTDPGVVLIGGAW
jgi:hypothetical protein